MPAPRGVPQIEVTFDIDANGIVNVSAKDMGTGAEQKITITASSNMTEEEIQRAVKEAEEYAAQDKELKERIDAKNNADNLVYQSEKILKDMGDKLDPNDKSNIEKEIENVKNAMATDKTEEIKAATEKLQQAFYAVSEKIYRQTANPQEGAAEANNTKSDENVYDAEYKVVDEDEEDNK